MAHARFANAHLIQFYDSYTTDKFKLWNTCSREPQRSMMCQYLNKTLALLGIGLILIAALTAQSVQAETAVNANSPRMCYTCEGINCQRTTKTNVTITCSDLLDICVTIFNEYEVVARGCFEDMPEMYRSKCDERNNPECLKCFGQLCNDKGRADFKCIECNSKDNSKCISDTSALTPVQCKIPTAQNSYCYVRHSESDGTERGCLVNQRDQLDCAESASCSLCLSNDGEACNAYALGATAAAGVNLLSTGAVVIAVLFRLLAAIKL